MVACRFGRSNIVRTLLEDNAIVNIQDNDGSAAIHYAAERGDIEICELLVLKKADLATENKKGQLPLDLATTPDCKAFFND